MRGIVDYERINWPAGTRKQRKPEKLHKTTQTVTFLSAASNRRVPNILEYDGAMLSISRFSRNHAFQLGGRK